MNLRTHYLKTSAPLKRIQNLEPSYRITATSIVKLKANFLRETKLKCEAFLHATWIKVQLLNWYCLESVGMALHNTRNPRLFRPRQLFLSCFLGFRLLSLSFCETYSVKLAFLQCVLLGRTTPWVRHRKSRFKALKTNELPHDCDGINMYYWRFKTFFSCYSWDVYNWSKVIKQPENTENRT